MSAMQQVLMSASGAGAAPDATVFLLHGDGTNGSTTFIDSGPNGFTLTGSSNAQISTAQSVFGGASMDFTHASNEARVVTPTDAALAMDGDFCFEMRFRMTSVAAGIYFLIADANVLDLYAYTGGTGKLYLYLLGYASTDVATISADTWYALCIDRLGNSLKAFLDGVQVAHIPSVTTGMGTSATWYFGSNPAFSGGGTGGRCYIDEARLWAASLHQANYTPEASAFTYP